MLKITELTKKFGANIAVDRTNITVKQPAMIGIIGRSGAGKSTLLRTISGLMSPSAGAIVFDGAPIQRETPEAIVTSGIIHVPEGRRLFPLMSVKDNLMVGAYNKRAKKDALQTLDKVYAMLPRLQERENQTAMTLSGGEQQMVAIGRGLMAQPHLLMLDEPSLGLAPILIRDIFETVRKIADQGTTVLMVEQDVKHSLSLSDRGYVLEHGRVAMEGNAEDLIDDPHVKEAYLGI